MFISFFDYLRHKNFRLLAVGGSVSTDIEHNKFQRKKSMIEFIIRRVKNKGKAISMIRLR